MPKKSSVIGGGGSGQESLRFEGSPSVEGTVITADSLAVFLGIDKGLITKEFLSCCVEILMIVNKERLVQNKPILNQNERIILIHEMYRTYCDFKEHKRKDGSGYFDSHLCGVVKVLIQTEGIVGLPTVLAALKHDNIEDLINNLLIDCAGREADGQFEVSDEWSEQETAKRRGNFVEAARVKAKGKEEKRLAEELIDSGDYWRKLSPDIAIQDLNDLRRIVRTLVEGVTKFRKARREATAEATFRRLLQVALEAIRTIYVKLADRAHNVETIVSHTRDAQERIMTETEVQYLALARILRVRKMVQFYVEQCCRFFNPDLFDEFEKLGVERRKRLSVNRKDEVLRFFKRKSLNGDIYTVFAADFVNLDMAHYAALLDKPFEEATLDDLSIGPFDPMEEILITVDLKKSGSRLFALSNLATAIENKFASTDKAKCDRSIAPSGDPDNVLGMKLVCYNPRYGHLRFRINDTVSEARSKRGVLAEAASQETPKDVQQMIKAILSKSMGAFHGLKGAKQLAQAELLKPRISVSTPKSDVYSLPRGSNGLDFAAAIHGGLVCHMSGLLMLPGITSMVPARPVDPLAPLEDGRVYEVQKDRAISPKPEWLLFAGTAAASAIRGHLAEISDREGEDGRAYLERLSGIFNIPGSELLEIFKRKYDKKSPERILQDVAVGIINPVLVLAEYIEFRNNRWRSNVRGWARWRNLRKEGVSDGVIDAEIAGYLQGISKWEVEVCVPEDVGSLNDFSAEFRREVGIKIDQIRGHIPGRGGETGKLILIFDLDDNEMSVYDFFVKLVKLNFKYPVRITQPIVKSLREMREITGVKIDAEVG